MHKFISLILIIFVVCILYINIFVRLINPLPLYTSPNCPLPILFPFLIFSFEINLSRNIFPLPVFIWEYKKKRFSIFLVFYLDWIISTNWCWFFEVPWFYLNQTFHGKVWWVVFHDWRNFHRTVWRKNCNRYNMIGVWVSLGCCVWMIFYKNNYHIINQLELQHY